MIDAEPPKPNIVYILADDMGYGDLTCLNSESKIHTVNLDRMAAAGMIFKDAHSSSAVCTPSRYSILTGRYNWRSRMKKGVLGGYSRHLIEPGRMTVASQLKAQGYNTAMIGKWHLGWDWATTNAKPAKGDGSNVDFKGEVKNGPDCYGFDYYYGHCGSLDMAPYVYVENGKATAQPNRFTKNKEKFSWWREGPTAADFEHKDVLPNFTKRSAKYIEGQAASGNPFFLYLPIPAPHTPILPLPEFRGKSGTNPYGDFCLQVDDSVGQIMAALERSGVADNTILVFTSDNGCSPEADFEELKKTGHNPSHIFRGHKADIYEGGHRIPLIIRWPKGIKAGTSSDETVCLVDLMATMADIIEKPLPDNAGEDSVSNLPLWQGKKIEGSLREATVHHSVNGSFSIRKGNWKLELCPGSGGWSYPKPGHDDMSGMPEIQLYDLNGDIGERENVYAQHPEVVKELTKILTRYVKNGRSTPGAIQLNTGAPNWPQLDWMAN